MDLLENDILLGPELLALPSSSSTKPKHKKIKAPLNESDIVPIPTSDADASTFPARTYTWSQLKYICRQLKIKVTGNKTELTTFIQQHLHKGQAAKKVQRWWKQQVWRRFTTLRGPARFKRSLCVNDDDFFTMDPVKEIPLYQFISYADEANVVYGFDVMSLFNLVTKCSSYTDNLLNPYNRDPLPHTLLRNLKIIVHYSRLLNKDVNVKFALNTPPPTPHLFETRLTTLFHDMDNLGNYTDSRWFLDLQRVHLVKFMVDLRDIWTYRANLSDEVKRSICPNGSMLHDVHQVINMNLEFNQLRMTVLHIMENFVRSGINRDSRCLGTNYVLCALTLVSPAAAEALPWLYHSAN